MQPGWDEAIQIRREVSFTRYCPQARVVLEALLSKYEDDEVVTGLDDPRILQLALFNAMGTMPQLIQQFGSRPDYERAVHELQAELFKTLQGDV